MLISTITCAVTFFLIAQNWVYLTVLPLAILILAFFNTVAGGSTALVLSLFSLIFLIFGGGELARDFRYVMIGVSALFLTGGICIVYYSVKVID
jgi:hypothetical protein